MVVPLPRTEELNLLTPWEEMMLVSTSLPMPASACTTLTIGLMETISLVTAIGKPTVFRMTKVVKAVLLLILVILKESTAMIKTNANIKLTSAMLTFKAGVMTAVNTVGQMFV